MVQGNEVGMKPLLGPRTSIVPLRVHHRIASEPLEPVCKWASKTLYPIGSELLDGAPAAPPLLLPALLHGLRAKREDSTGPGHPSHDSGSCGPPALPESPQLPPWGNSLLLGKLIHYSLKAPFLAGSKLPVLHFAATT